MAKHKLVYPILSLRTHVPAYMQIVPVYLRAIRRTHGAYFYVAECAFEPGAEGTVAGLTPARSGCFVLPGFGTQTRPGSASGSDR